MVDVHLRVLGEALVDAVDDRLQRSPLARAVLGPHRLVVAVRVEQAPEVLEAPVLVPERVALEVEEEITRRRVG